MSDKKLKRSAQSGLGRSLNELLNDNDELTNLECKVLMHKSDGSMVKIYNKVDKKPEIQPKKQIEAQNERAKGKSTAFDKDNFQKMEIIKRSSEEKSSQGERIMIGKTRSEREDEARGIYRHGKPHVVSEGESVERIHISAKEKPKPEPPRIVLDAKSTSFSGSDGQGSISEALEKLDRYRPRAEDEFLDALREITDVSSPKEYAPDKNGRIVIGGNSKAKVKKR